jgi:TonB family protein
MHNFLKTVRQEAGIGADASLNPYTAAALSVMPGLGQLYNGQKAKAFLFMDVAFVNFLLLGFVLLAQPLSRALSAISTEFHARANVDLIHSLQHVAPGSAISNIVLLLVLSFAIYAARDAYDTARTRQVKAIYPDSVIGMAEAASGSYLMHLAMMFTCAVLALFLLIPAPQRSQWIEIDMIPPSLVAKVPPTNKYATAPSPGTRTVTVKQPHPAPEEPSSAKYGQTNHALHKPVVSSPPSPSIAPTVTKPIAVPQIKPVMVSHPMSPMPQPLKISTNPTPLNIAPPVHPQVVPVASLPTPVRLNLSRINAQPAPTATPLERSKALSNVPLPSSLAHNNAGLAAPQPVAATASTSSMKSPVPGSGSSSTQSASSALSNAAGPMPSKAVPRIAFGGPAVMPSVSPGPSHVFNHPGTTTGDNPDPTVPGVGKGQQASPDNPPGGLTKGAGRNPPSMPIEVDFTKYMADLQRRIKSHWMPHKISMSNRVIVDFNISRAGELSELRLMHSSGTTIVDDAAMQAVRNSAPFPPLPEGADEKVLIQFTFDYNVFNGGNGSVIRY